MIIKKVYKSDFTDPENAMQYYSAEDSGIDIIIRKNFFDFKMSPIPVYHRLLYQAVSDLKSLHYWLNMIQTVIRFNI